MAKATLRDKATQLTQAVEDYQAVERSPEFLVRYEGKVIDVKAAFHTAARAFLKGLGIPGDIRSNKGGPAVSGEVTLHGDSVYIQLSADSEWFFFRTCKGRKDYTGGRNCIVYYHFLVADLDSFVSEVTQLSQGDV